MSTTTTSIAIIEVMPDHLRASHQAAGNWGQYPHNGAERMVIDAEDVGDYVSDDDEYDHVVCVVGLNADGSINADRLSDEDLAALTRAFGRPSVSDTGAMYFSHVVVRLDTDE